MPGMSEAARYSSLSQLLEMRRMLGALFALSATIDRLVPMPTIDGVMNAGLSAQSAWNGRLALILVMAYAINAGSRIG